MNQAPDDHHYNEWLQQKRSQQAPHDLSGQIMDTIEQEQEPPEYPSARLAHLAFCAKAALLALAALVGVSRYACLLFCLLFG